MPVVKKAQVKKNLADLQKKINTTPRARTAFLKNPAAALRRAGVDLSPERVRSINAFVDKQIKTPGARVAGAGIRPSGAADGVEVVVSVGVKF
jgi:hypothetical protein